MEAHRAGIQSRLLADFHELRQGFSPTAQASEQEIQGMMHFVDKVAEIQNTLRVITPVTLS